jgi:hypothetical protein
MSKIHKRSLEHLNQDAENQKIKKINSKDQNSRKMNFLIMTHMLMLIMYQ